MSLGKVKFDDAWFDEIALQSAGFRDHYANEADDFMRLVVAAGGGNDRVKDNLKKTETQKVQDQIDKRKGCDLNSFLKAVERNG